jgi:hypothetical protein
LGGTPLLCEISHPSFAAGSLIFPALESAGHRPPLLAGTMDIVRQHMERVLKSITALILATLVAATFTQPAAAATQRRDTSTDYTQSGPTHTGPLYRGYPVRDWYIY